jgi:hypothetical protein
MRPPCVAKVHFVCAIAATGSGNAVVASRINRGDTQSEASDMTGIEHLYDAHPDFVRSLTRLSERLGSNDGGLFESPLGQWLYLKRYPGPGAAERSKNEKLAAELYKLAGVPHADVRLTEWEGKPAVLSRWVDGHPLSDFKKSDFDKIKELHEGWPADAWLLNYDAVGNHLSNIVVDKDNIAHRINAGGALRYRANGGLKKHQRDGVEVLENLKDPEITTGASKVFRGLHIHPADPSALGVARLAATPDESISALVYRYGPSSPTERRRLLRGLIERKHDIAGAYRLEPGVPHQQDQMHVLSISAV